MQTIYYHFRKHTTLQNGKNSARKQVPQSARLSEGGGCDRYLGNAQIDPTFFKLGLPLVCLLTYRLKGQLRSATRALSSFAQTLKNSANIEL